jgi:hypothetical protein
MKSTGARKFNTETGAWRFWCRIDSGRRRLTGARSKIESTTGNQTQAPEKSNKNQILGEIQRTKQEPAADLGARSCSI